LRAGKPVKLQQQPFKVLTLLAQQPGRLVTRGEIAQHLWGENTFVDYERGLNFAMVQIRAALEDSSGNPRFIETLPRRGYRFIAPVSSGSEPLPSKGHVQGATLHSRRLPRRWWWLGTAAVVVAAAGFSIQPDHSLEAPQVSARQTIVVLPFKNLGPAEDRFFADGMAEEITSRLARVRGLGVISRTSADQYAAAGKTVGQIGAELGVDFVLEGAVQWERQQGGPSRVRIMPQLIRVADDVHVWSRVYTRDLVEIFRLQTELTQAVVGELDVGLRAWEQGALETRPTENLQAYQAYLRGLDAAARYSGDDDTRLAVHMFQRAVELDPDFALAHARLEQLLALPSGLEMSAPLLEMDPAFRSLHDHPRYSELLRRLASRQL
jgi:TolB-like protein/DNA-binding winged helix-turn-helix (wHTH) protein